MRNVREMDADISNVLLESHISLRRILCNLKRIAIDRERNDITDAQFILLCEDEVVLNILVFSTRTCSCCVPFLFTCIVSNHLTPGKGSEAYRRVVISGTIHSTACRRGMRRTVQRDSIGNCNRRTKRRSKRRCDSTVATRREKKP